MARTGTRQAALAGRQTAAGWCRGSHCRQTHRRKAGSWRPSPV